jgi:hypothetical protein
VDEGVFHDFLIGSSEPVVERLNIIFYPLLRDLRLINYYLFFDVKERCLSFVFKERVVQVWPIFHWHLICYIDIERVLSIIRKLSIL